MAFAVLLSPRRVRAPPWSPAAWPPPSPPPVAIAAALASAVMFPVAPALGCLQGELRFARYAMVLVARGRGPAAASASRDRRRCGPPGAIHRLRRRRARAARPARRDPRDLTLAAPRAHARRARWAETGDIALAQFVVSSLVGSDVVLLAPAGDGTPTDAGFQAPVHAGEGARLRRRGHRARHSSRCSVRRAAVDEILRAAWRAFAGSPCRDVRARHRARRPRAHGVARAYADALVLLPWLAAAGPGFAAVTVLATVLLALRAYRRSQLALLSATLLMAAGFAAGWRLGGTYASRSARPRAHLRRRP